MEHHHTHGCLSLHKSQCKFSSLILWLFFVFFTGERKICSIICDFFCSRFLIGSSKGHDSDRLLVFQCLSNTFFNCNLLLTSSLELMLYCFIMCRIKIKFSYLINYCLLQMKNCHFNILLSSTSDIVMNDVLISTLKYIIKWNVMGSPQGI